MDYTIATAVTGIGDGDTAPATGTKGEFTNGNPATSTPATVLPAYQMNALVQEIINTIVGASLTPSKSNNAQLLAAIQALIPIGIAAYLAGRSWHNVMGSRAIGTVYTNSTGGEIYVAASIQQGGATSTYFVYVNGVAVVEASDGPSYINSCVVPVPAGATYEVALSAGTLLSWYEYH